MRNNLGNVTIITHTDDPADPYVHVDEATVALVTGKKVGLIANKDTGLTFMGDVSIKAMPENIIVADMFKFNNMMMSCLPSTIYTPIPVFKQAYNDRVNAVKDIMSIVRELKSVLGSLVGA